jgi:hypothetical protein
LLLLLQQALPFFCFKPQHVGSNALQIPTEAT